MVLGVGRGQPSVRGPSLAQPLELNEIVGWPLLALQGQYTVSLQGTDSNKAPLFCVAVTFQARELGSRGMAGWDWELTL